jgi:hypothetical protein
MAYSENAAERATERQGNGASNASLYASIYSGYDGSGSKSISQKHNVEDGKSLDFGDTANLYGQQSHQFQQQHPWRADVLNGAEDLRQDLRKDAGHLDDHYEGIRKDILSVKHEEEADAKANGGHITAQEKAHLLSEEGDISKELNKDYALGGKHHGKGGHHHPGDPTSPPEGTLPPGGSTPPGDTPPPGQTVPPGDTPPPGSVPPGGDTPPSGQPTPPADGKLLLGTAVIPGDVGASTYSQALQNFDNKVGVSSNEQMLYTNQNLGKTPDVASMQADVKAGITPVLSLRTIDYADVASGKDDAYLTQVAKDVKSVDGTVIMRPNWEMDGSARQQYGTPEQFKAAWIHMHDLFAAQGVTNAKWAFTPDAQAYDSKEPSWSSPASEYYPGNQYVDYIGSDGYSGLHGAAAQSPSQIFSAGVNFAEQQGKPFMIGETGVNTGLGTQTDVKYMQDMAAYIKANPDIQALSWFTEGSNSVLGNPQEIAAYNAMEKSLGAGSA